MVPQAYQAAEEGNMEIAAQELKIAEHQAVAGQQQAAQAFKNMQAGAIEGLRL